MSGTQVGTPSVRRRPPPTYGTRPIARDKRAASLSVRPAPGRRANLAEMPTHATGTDRRPIVCGVDDSDGSRAALAFAARLARGLGVQLVLAHASERGHPPPGRALAAERIRASEPELIGRVARDADVTDYRFARVESPWAAKGLLTIASSERAELLVVGSRGRGLVRARLLGSVSEEVARRARCPVVVVPPGAAEGYGELMRRPVIACGIDGSDNALDAARVSGELARRLGRRVLLLHASPPSEPMHAMTTAGGGQLPRSGYPLVGPEKREAQARLRRAAEAVGAGVRVDAALEIADPVSSLLEVAEREAAEMLVVGSRGRGPVRAIVLGSVSRELAALADRPVLIVPAGQRQSA
jgi:nucleotide-binding universal stress UspA family protein